jgi:5-methylthioadenosine/S-adenosylhomocysteine deaminase
MHADPNDSPPLHGAAPSADLVITDCTALVDTSGPTATFLRGASIVVRGGSIESVLGPGQPVPAAEHTIDAGGMVAMPGLVNTHCHAAMTLFRGAAEDVEVNSWFNEYIWPMEVNLTERDVYLGTMVACAEMISCGVTTFADQYFHMHEAARAVDESGMRANLGWAFFSTQGDEGLDVSVDFAERFRGAANGRISTSIVPHAPYTVSDEHLSRAADHARRLGVRVHTHASEDIAQTRRSIAERGITPIDVLDRTGVLDAGCIIAHGNGIVDSDIPLLSERRDRVGVGHGPKGYLKFALERLTPLRQLIDAGVPVGYCTDGAASNNTLDILENMRFTATSQKFVVDDATWFTSATALHMAGPGSAAVVGMSGQLGTLQPGARADIILVDVSGFHCQPLHDTAAAIVYSVQPSDVRTTIVDGRVLMRDRTLLTIDTQSLLDEFRDRANTITDRSHGRTIQDYRAR